MWCESGSCAKGLQTQQHDNATVLDVCFCLWLALSYDEALQALADSEAKRETADKELSIVSGC